MTSFASALPSSPWPSGRGLLCAAIVLVLGGVVVAGAVDAAHDWVRRQANAEAERRSLPRRAANSIKHAFAAAETYALIRRSGLAPQTTARIVDALGRANEIIEHYGRLPRRRDTAREIYKDLYSNAGGLTAAVWLEENCPVAGRAERLTLIGRLVADRVIPDHPRHAQVRTNVDGSLSSVWNVIDLFEFDRVAVDRTLAAPFATMPPCASGG